MIAKLKPYQHIAERFVFPALLLIWPFVGLLSGISLKDPTYSLAGYQYGELLDQTWFLATWLAQLTGRLFTRLPYGDTFAGMNAYCTLLICLAALSVYYLLRRFELSAWMIFLGEWIAESLCWCPRVILYNYLTYLLMTFGALLLLCALISEKRTALLLFLSGLVLGANMFVRFPNLTECALILALIAYGVWAEKSRLRVLKEMAVSLGGYLTGILVPFIIIRVLYGMEAYPEMIASLFSMTKEAKGHSAGMMIRETALAYAHTLSRMAVMIPAVGAGIVMFLWKKDRYVKGKRILYAAGCVLLLLFYFKTGTFTLNYWYYDCMFQAAMMMLIVSIILFVADIAGLLKGHAHEKLLSLTALLIILITPLGSDNYTFPVINNLFLVAPAAVGALRRAVRRAGHSSYAHLHTAWVMLASAIGCVLLIQGTIFHAVFSFDDGADGSVRTAREERIPKLSGMVTTAENAAHLEALYDLVLTQDLSGTPAVFFGDIPGLSYCLDLPPAIFTTWPDLDSNTVSRFDKALEELKTPPLIIIHGDGTGYEQSERKYVLLQNYMLQHHYEKIFEDDFAVIYQAAEQTS